MSASNLDEELDECGNEGFRGELVRRLTDSEDPLTRDSTGDLDTSAAVVVDTDGSCRSSFFTRPEQLYKMLLGNLLAT